MDEWIRRRAHSLLSSECVFKVKGLSKKAVESSTPRDITEWNSLQHLHKQDGSKFIRFLKSFDLVKASLLSHLKIWLVFYQALKDYVVVVNPAKYKWALLSTHPPTQPSSRPYKKGLTNWRRNLRLLCVGFSGKSWTLSNKKHVLRAH